MTGAAQRAESSASLAVRISGSGATYGRRRQEAAREGGRPTPCEQMSEHDPKFRGVAPDGMIPRL